MRNSNRRRLKGSCSQRQWQREKKTPRQISLVGFVHPTKYNGCTYAHDIVAYAYKHGYTPAHIHVSLTCAHLCIALKELTEDLNSVAADWFELGVQLDIEDGELRGVSGKENAAAKCFQKTLSLWWKSGTPTLKAITDALRSSVIGHNNLARKVEKGLFI